MIWHKTCHVEKDSRYKFVEAQGVIKEFHVPKNEDPTSEQHQLQWLYANTVCGNSLLTSYIKGTLGFGNNLSPFNIKTNDDMSGLSSGLCCTHNRPTSTHRMTSDATKKHYKITVLKFGNQRHFIFELIQLLSRLLGKPFHC
ncbi:hypothetical protein CR513_12394, partial [Mucuna pruriens]